MADVTEAEMRASVARAFGRSPKIDTPELAEAAGLVFVAGRTFADAADVAAAQAFGRITEAEATQARASLAKLTGLAESTKAATTGRLALQEANRVAPVKASTGKLTVTLISAGAGSSGYYAPAVLEAAARDKVFPAGTHCYVDHPTQREDAERPARSVRDLAAVLTTDARWNAATSSLTAEAQLMPAWKDTFGDSAMAAAIGMSIRADGDVEMGEVDGRRQLVVSKLIHGQSVDFVTRAGRGGSYSVIEGWNRW